MSKLVWVIEVEFRISTSDLELIHVRNEAGRIRMEENTNQCLMFKR